MGPIGDQAGSSVPAVQCKILLGGNPYEPTAEDWQTFNNELLKKLHNDGNPPSYPFKDHDELSNAMHMRASLIETMLKNVTADMGVDSTEPFSLPPEWTPGRSIRRETRRYATGRGYPQHLRDGEGPGRVFSIAT